MSPAARADARTGQTFTDLLQQTTATPPETHQGFKNSHQQSLRGPEAKEAGAKLRPSTSPGVHLPTALSEANQATTITPPSLNQFTGWQMPASNPRDTFSQDGVALPAGESNAPAEQQSAVLSRPSGPLEAQSPLVGDDATQAGISTTAQVVDISAPQEQEAVERGGTMASTIGSGDASTSPKLQESSDSDKLVAGQSLEVAIPAATRPILSKSQEAPEPLGPGVSNAAHRGLERSAQNAKTSATQSEDADSANPSSSRSSSETSVASGQGQNYAAVHGERLPISAMLGGSPGWGGAQELMQPLNALQGTSAASASASTPRDPQIAQPTAPVTPPAFSLPSTSLSKSALSTDISAPVTASPDTTVSAGALSPDSLAVASSGTAAHSGPGQPPTAPAPAAQQVAEASPALMHTRMIQSLTGSQVQVSMHSEDFGRITVHAGYGRDTLAAQITLESPQLGAALSSHLPAMEQKLASDHGMRTSVTLSTGLDSGGTPDHPREGTSSSTGRQPFSTKPQALTAAMLAVTNGGAPLTLEPSNSSGAAPRLNIRI